MPEFFLILILFLLIFLLILIYKESFFLCYIIITLLAVPSDLSTSLRMVIHITDYILLLFLFFKEYGLEIKRYPIVLKNLVYVLILLYASMIIATIFSNYPFAGFQLIIRTTAFFLLIYLFYGIISTENHVKLVFYSLLLVGMILMTGIIIDFLIHGGNIEYIIRPIRETSFGIYKNRNIAGSYSIIIFPVVIILLFRSNKKLLFLLISIIILFSTILIASRSSLAGIILSSVITFFFINKKIYRILLSSVIIIIFLYLVLPISPDFDTALRLSSGLSQHNTFWELATNIIGSHPVLGIGPGAYPHEEFNYIPVMLNTYSGSVVIDIHDLTMADGSNNSHNLYLAVASDMGILGVLFIILLGVFFFNALYKTYRKYKNNNEIRLNLIIIISAGICLFLRGIVESAGIFGYGAISTDLPFWLLVLILISYYTDRFTEKKTEII